MAPLPASIELALAVDARGRILGIGRLPRELDGGLSPGSSFAALVSPKSAAAALDFLFALRRDGVALGPELELVDGAEGGLPLCFAGAASRAGFWITAGRSRAALVRGLRGALAAAGEGSGPGTEIQPAARSALAARLAGGEGKLQEDRELRVLLRLLQRRLRRLLRADLPSSPSSRDAARLEGLCQRLLAHLEP